MCKYFEMMFFIQKQRKQNTIWTPPPPKKRRSDTNSRDYEYTHICLFIPATQLRTMRRRDSLPDLRQCSAINGEENVDTNKAKAKSISFQDMVTTSLKNEDVINQIAPKLAPTLAEILKPFIQETIQENIKDKVYTHSSPGFSTYTKKIYIEKYENSCQIRNCYVCNNN